MSQRQDAPFGLGAIAADGKLVFLPLDSVSVNAFILDVSALVVITQKYLAAFSHSHLTNARYLFPIPEGASVCAFRMQLSNGSVVSGQVKETEKAKKIFHDAVAQGEWAGLAYEITADVFAISVGAIPLGEDVEVKITYATTVPDDELLNQIRFAIPTFIGKQRYGHAPLELSQGRSSDDSATLSFRATIQLTSNIISVTSPSHDIDVLPSQRAQSTPLSYITTVRLPKPVPFDRDLVLSIQSEKLDAPRCVAEVDEKAQTVALSLTTVPRFGAPIIKSQEYIFLIDRSGSMGADYRIDYAKDALRHLIKGLPTQNTVFNIISFGSEHSSLFTKSVNYARNTVQQAEQHIDSMSANMGGTEIGQALGWTFRNRDPSVPTAVVVLTDGDVYQPEHVISLVRNAVQSTSSGSFVRVFTLGIGAGASTALCEGIARAGNGVCYMTSKSEEIKGRSSKLLLAARTLPYGSVSGISIDWGYESVPRTRRASATRAKPSHPQPKKVNIFYGNYNPLAAAQEDTGPKFVLPPAPVVLQAPPRIPNLYPGNRFLVSAILTNTVKVPEVVKLSGVLPDGTMVEIPPIKVTYYVAKTDERPPLLHTLAAHRIIRTLEDGDLTPFGLNDNGDQGLHDEMVQAAVVAYGTRYSLATRFTAFVAVKDSPPGGAGVNRKLPEDRDYDEGISSIEESEEDIEARVKRPAPRMGLSSKSSVTSGAIPAKVSRTPSVVSRVLEKWNSRRTAQKTPEKQKGEKKVEEETKEIGEKKKVEGKTKEKRSKDTTSPEVHSENEDRPASPWQEVSFTPNSVQHPTNDSRAISRSSDCVSETFSACSVLPPPQPPVERRSASISTRPPAPVFAPHREADLPMSRSSMDSPPRAHLSGIHLLSAAPIRNDTPSPSAAPAYGSSVPFSEQPVTQLVEEPWSQIMPIASAQASLPHPISTVPSLAPRYELNEVIVAGTDPVSGVARVQEHDGSFALDDKLLALLREANRGLTLHKLADTIPEELRSLRAASNGLDVERVWATVLAAAYMLGMLRDRRAIWEGLWEKAREYVCGETQIASFMFVQLVQQATDVLFHDTRSGISTVRE